MGALIRALSQLGVTVADRLDDRPDVVLVPGGAPAGFLDAVRERGISVVQRLDGVFFDANGNYRKQNQPLKDVYDLADHVIFQSEFSLEMASRYLGRPGRHRIIYNAADPAVFNPDGSTRRPPYDHVLLAASRWRPHKRLRDLLAAFDHLRDGKTCLVLAGSAAGLSELPRPGADVLTLGDISQLELSEWMRGADVFVHPAWRDWCPNVVVQSLACGVPVVCPDMGGTKEIVGEAGLVLDSGETETYEPLPLYDESQIARLDSLKLAEAITSVLARKAEYWVRAVRRTETVLSMNLAARSYLEVFEQAMRREEVSVG
ncbi:glycosyltransferase family 4 protein [bacterium]|nr:glycosyltransferase family 4 protein [bacterium]